MIRKRMAMWALACTATVWMFSSVGCGGGDDGNDCLGVLPPASIDGEYRATNFTAAPPSGFSNCPSDTRDAILGVFQGKRVHIRYDQSGHDVFVPDPSMNVEFAGCADEDSTVQTEGSFADFLNPSADACTIEGNRVILTTGISSGTGALSGTLGFPLKISPQCNSCLTSCFVTLGFSLAKIEEPTVGAMTPTPTPESLLELADLTQEALQAGLDAAPPNTCAPTSTPTLTPTRTPTFPTFTPTLTPTDTPKSRE